MKESRPSPYQNIPEPLPIPVDPAIDERAAAFLRELTLGRIDRHLLDERLSDRWAGTGMSASAEKAAALGTIESMYAFEQRTTAEGVATYYRVRYPSGLWTWVFSINTVGRINGFSLRPRPGHYIFDVWLRNVNY